MDIRDISNEELVAFLTANGQKAFRAKQVWQWIWEKGVGGFSEMKNIPGELQSLLSDNYTLQKAALETTLKAKDGTTKVGFRFRDDQVAEGVFIPSRKRVTACVSAQTGCKLNCSFCATGLLSMGRDLSAGEIFDQVFEIKRMAEAEEKNLSNIVYMGMGEPLLNYDAVMKSIEYVISKPGLAMSPSRITLSTAGIVSGIRRLADDGAKFHLAISLHSANNKIRSSLMPINKKYPLEELSEAIQYFHEKTGERITFEYLMLKDVNDTLTDAEELAVYCRSFPVKINIIEFNPVKELPYEPSTTERVDQFVKFLESRNMVVNVRQSRGHEIDAACGQLANRQMTPKNA
jgi:23S rRNA (adenine2503-C2)-methyltransferase